MNKIWKVIWILIILQAICLVLAYLTDWTTTNNVFISIGLWINCFVSGLLIGGILAENCKGCNFYES